MGKELEKKRNKKKNSTIIKSKSANRFIFADSSTEELIQRMVNEAREAASERLKALID